MKKRQDQTNAKVDPNSKRIRKQATDGLLASAENQPPELPARQLDLEIQNEELLQARDLLEESRDRYVDFYDFSPVGYLTLSHKSLITEINLTGAAMLGEERDKLRRRRFAEFIALEDNDSWIRHFMVARQEEGKLTCELSIVRSDGSRLDVQIDSLRLARDGQEPMVRLALTDITARKSAEAALRASENRQRQLEQQKIIQTSLDGFWVARAADARILEANEAFCNMVGYSREELRTMYISDLDSNESPADTAAHIKKVMELGYDRFETRHRHKQGHLVDIEVSVSHSKLDGGINLVFARDITERKQAEEALRDSERKFRTLAENFPDILIRYDREGRRTYVNPAMKQIFAVSDKQTIGLTQMQSNPLGLPEAYQLALKRVLATGKRGEFEMQLPTVSGNVGVGFVTIAAERAADGQICGAIVIGRDITKLKQAEQQLRELAAHIQTVREEEKARLAREIHDDLGSTLAALKLKLSHLMDFQLDEEMKRTPLFARLESMSQILESAIASSRRIITDMRPDVLDNLGLFAALKWQAEQFQKRTGIECRCACAYDHGCVDCSSCEYTLDKAVSINLFRIFQESLTNVSKHSGASRVESEYRPENDQLFLSISDNGCGLREGYVTAPSSFGMRGMRERVGQLEGEISFDMPPGGGMRVTVRVPMSIGTKDRS